MYNLIPLKKASDYSSDKIDVKDVTLENYITTDNLLQNKHGVIIADNLPSQGTSLVKYSKENILVANIRPYLKKIWFSNKVGGCSADVLVFKVKEDFDPRFVYYSIFRNDFFVHTMKGSKGTKMPRGDKTQIMEFLIPNLKYSTQQKIAAVLSSLDAKIELNNRINTELEQMAKTLYDYWFVQFDFPNEQGKPYKSSGGKMVYNEELKREIPEGWEVKKLSEISTLKAGGDKPEFCSEEKTEFCSVPIYSNGIVNDGLYGYTNKSTISNQSITISASPSFRVISFRDRNILINNNIQPSFHSPKLQYSHSSQRDQIAFPGFRPFWLEFWTSSLFCFPALSA